MTARSRLVAYFAANFYFFASPKSTVGGVEICASFCTVKLGLGA
jgi:hypothetical protein